MAKVQLMKTTISIHQIREAKNTLTRKYYSQPKIIE